MPFDGSGNFQRVMNWVADAAASIKIRADRHDQEDDNLASGLSMCLTKDGQTQPTANIPMNGKKIVNLANPTANTDAVNKAYADAIRTFSTAVTMSGNDGAGRILFRGTGNLGLSFEQADLSFGVKEVGNNGTTNRFVWMDTYAYTGILLELKAGNGAFNWPGASAQFQIADRTVWTLADGYGSLAAPSLYVTGRDASDTAYNVIFRDDTNVTRARFGYNRADGRSLFDLRNAAGAITNSLELGNDLYLQNGAFLAPNGSAAAPAFAFTAATDRGMYTGAGILGLSLGGTPSLTISAADVIAFATTLRARANSGATATNLTLQDSAGINRAVLTADMANSRTTIDYRNNAGAVQQSIQISAAAGLTVTSGANAGDIVTTGNLGSLQVYNGGSTVNTAFPIGTTLLVNRGIVTPRNSSVALALDSANSNDYVVGGAGASLPGVWRGSGNAMISAGNFIFNATRTA